MVCPGAVGPWGRAWERGLGSGEAGGHRRGMGEIYRS